MRTLPFVSSVMVFVVLTSGVAVAQNRREGQKQAPAPSSTADLLRDALEAKRRGDLPKATNLFAAAQKSKEFANARPPVELIFAVGDFYFGQSSPESYAQALATYDLAATVYGKELPAFQFAQMRAKRAEVLGWLGKTELARDEINSIRQTYKNERRPNLIADLASANLQLLANQGDAAREALLPLTELNDDVIAPSALFSLGRAYVQLKQPEEAINTFRQLWSRYGESEFVKQAVYLIGKVYFDRGDFMEARKLYEACAVVGAAMQRKVRVGDELIVKVSDPDYFARTRSQTLSVAINAPSGDLETLRLEKNPVSDQLYVGRIQTALLLPKPGDGQLQVAGNDVIEISYQGLAGKPYQVQVVDDGAIQVDSVALPAPTPRHERTMAKTPAKSARRDEAADLIVIPSAKVGSGAVSPGSPVYVQIVDGDLDTTDKPDTVTAEVVASLKGKETDTVTIKLTETGARTGVFTGIANTEPLAADASASSEADGRRAYFAIDDNTRSFWKPKPNTLKEGQKHFLEINLRQPAELGKLTWGPGEAAIANSPTAMRVLLRGDDTDVTFNVSGKPKPVDNIVDLKKTFARIVRLEFDGFSGDAPAIGQIVITDSAGNRLIPTDIDPSSPDRKDKLAFDVGHQVFAGYVDEENESPGRSITRESRKLGVQYHDASLALATSDGDDANRRLIPAWRLDREGRQTIVINDADADTTIQPDSLKIMVYTESGDSQELTATETGPATGVFAAALPLASQADAKDNPRLLYVAEGDLLWMRYLDDRNMSPGYRTFRHNWVIENRPTVGDFLPRPLITTAWPFEVKPTTDGEMQAVARQPGRGRVMIEFADADAFPNASASATATINALLSDTSTEIVLKSAGKGVAGRPLDLILGDKETTSRVDAAQEDNDEPNPKAKPNKRTPRVSAGSEINVAGDDIVRIAVQDGHIGSSDSAVRDVMDEQAVKSYFAAPDERTKELVPIIKLSDPIRRMTKRQQDRLADLKTEMGLRLLASRLTGEQLTEYAKTIEARLVKTPASSELATTLRRQQVAVVSAIELNTSRIERLKALGAVEAKAFPATRPPDDEAAPAGKMRELLVDGPIIPDRPFVVLINDADLTGEKVDVRVRSLGGRLVQSLMVQADRQPDGTYKAVIATQRSSEKTESGALAVLPGGQVMVEYRDNSNPAGVSADRVEYLALAGDATIRSVNANYVDDVSQIRLGQQVYLEIIDRDADRSKALDTILATAVSSRGDKLQVMCSETEPHSGVFRGTFVTDFADPIAGDDVLQAGYGESLTVTYNDYLRQSPDSPIEKSLSIRVRGGSDGRIEAFSRQFQDSKEEMQLWYRTGEAAYQVGRKLYLAGAIARAEEYLSESTDYFVAVADRFPDDPLAASSNYYLGNIQSLRGRHREALARFQEVVSRWPKSEFVARARFKIGQAYEGLGQFDLAADAYVLLTYHHPQDENVPLAMIRMMNHYARNENWTDAVGIAQRFVTKFPAHDQAGAVALKAGQWLTVSGSVNEAMAWYTSAEKTFATNDRDMPALLYWHAATMIQGAKVGKQGERADKIRELLNRVVYDYGRSEYSSLAKVALDQINQNN